MLTNFDLLEYHPFASIVLDLDGKIVFSNKKTKLLLQEITSKEDIEEIKSLFPLFTFHETIQNHSVVDKQGNSVTYQTETTKYENGFYIVFIQKIIKNIAISKRKQVLIEQRYKVFEDFINTIKEGVLVFDSNGRLQFTNKKANNLLGITKVSSKNRLVWELIDYFNDEIDWKKNIELLSSQKIIKFILNRKNNYYQFEIQKKNYENQFFYLFIVNNITKKVKDTLIIKDQLHEIDFYHNNFPAAFFQLKVNSIEETYFEYISESFEKIFGVRLVTNQPNWGNKLLLHEDDVKTFKETKNKAIQNRTQFNYSGRIVLNDGKITWFEVNAIPIVRNKTVTFKGIIQNITERKNAEIDLNEKRFFNDTVLYNIPADIAFFDKDHNYLFINPKGITNETTRNWLIGKNDFDYCKMKGIDDTLATIRRGYFDQAVKTRKQVDWVDETNKEGKKTYILRRFHPIFNENKFINMIGYGIDISELKNLQLKLDDTQHQKELILKSSQIGIVIIENDWSVTFWNPQAEKIFGWKSDEVMGNNLSLIIFPKIEKVKYDIRDYFKKNKGQSENKKNFEFTAITKEKNEITIELTIVNADDNKISPKFIVFINDVTERKSREREIQFQNDMLIKQNKELEQFNFVTSHDLQEPLTSLIGYSNMLKEDYFDKLDDEGKLFLDFISNSAIRMRSLISGLLEYNRIYKNKETDIYDFNELISEVIDDLHSSILNRRAIITYDNLPTIKCYPVFCRQLLQNLISNAIKFSKKSTRSKINISAKETREKWIFSVKDNGIGIEEKYFEQIFIIFRRINNKDDYQGNGIGLAHCKKIVEIHNGEIWVNSTPNVGSTFYFTINKNI
ncbi:MAG: PAS domain S-box protein [Flavobacterium sp.]|uniref:PAS domain S-box protein n=1 Tax=Flavobacterium sp. TaxID=239 RepID=UPI003BC3B751